MSIDSELRNTSDRLLEQLTKLGELEAAKRDATPGSTEFVELSHQVETLAAELLGTSQRQSSLAAATEALKRIGADDAPSTPIAEIEPAREPNVILAEWRDAERRAAAATPGSAEEAASRRDVERLRDEYRRSFEAHR